MRSHYLCFLFCFLPNVLFSNEKLCAIFLNYALTDSLARGSDAKLEWLEFKHGSNLAPRLYDLSNPSNLPAAEAGLLNLVSERVLTQYDESVLNLRKGDSVVIDDEKFLLGEFLGAGNSAHIFRLQNRPGVIRIPFYSQSSADPKQGERRFGIMIKDMKNAVKVLHSDPKKLGRFTIVEEVRGTENGFEFMQRVAGKILDPSEYLHAKQRRWIGLSIEDRKKLNSLIALMDYNEQFMPRDRGVSKPRLESGRQYVFDVELNQWRFVDPH